MSTPLISIVSPVYLAEEIVDELVVQLKSSLSQITDSYEIILVEDGGPDNSWDKILQNCKKNKEVKGVKLSRNFGQHYAVTAGIEQSKGEFVFIMDCDLQDDPKYITILFKQLQTGIDVVFTKRKDRGHTNSKKSISNLYKFVLRNLGDKKYDINTGSMLGASRKACEAFLQFKEKDRLYVQVFKWIGFKSIYIEIPHNKRFVGESSYTLFKMISLGMQGITSHSTRLLKLSIYIGFFISFIAFLACVIIIILYFTMGFSPGWPSIFVAMAFATGLILISNGVLGIYLGKTFEQSKNRPLYIIDHKVNIDIESI
jgi:glycosyltransferase involved in cell wall biosynthesis